MTQHRELITTVLSILFAAFLFNSCRADAYFLGRGGGVTDHGALTGLSDDDHPQYTNVLVQRKSAESTTGDSTTTILPYDGTVPQNTEGKEILTVSITPKSASNVLRITACLPQLEASVNMTVTLAIFQDSTASALSSKPRFVATGGAREVC